MTKKLLLALPVFLLAACTSEREKMLERKWQEVEVKNDEKDKMAASKKMFMDTVGTHTDAARNKELYGYGNIDSFKRSQSLTTIQSEMTERNIIKHTQFDFKSNGVVLVYSLRGVDSASWKLDGDKLTMDKEKLKGEGGKLETKVLLLTDTMLRLRFTQQGISADAILKPSTN